MFCPEAVPMTKTAIPARIPLAPAIAVHTMGGPQASMIEAKATQSVLVRPRESKERYCANSADDAGLAAWRCQELPTAKQQKSE